MSGAIPFGTKTSGEGRTEIVIAVIQVVAVHIRAVRISVADVHKVAIRVANFPYLLAVCGINGTRCVVTRLAPFALLCGGESSLSQEISSLIV